MPKMRFLWFEIARFSAIFLTSFVAILAEIKIEPKVKPMILKSLKFQSLSK